MRQSKTVFFNDCVFRVHESVYEPAEDTFLLAENLVVNENETIIDMGTGCGILGILAAKKAERVVAMDINPRAVLCAGMNARLNGAAGKMYFLCGDLFEPLREHEEFDAIIFNAPYLPTEAGEKRSWMELAWSGGPTGRETIDRFISQAPSHLKEEGRVLLVQSSLSSIDETLKRLEENGLEARILAEKKVAFETIAVIQATTKTHETSEMEHRR